MIGKSTLITKAATNRFASEYVPRVCDRAYVTLKTASESKSIRACLWDTGGHNHYARIRTLRFFFFYYNYYLFCL